MSPSTCIKLLLPLLLITVLQASADPIKVSRSVAYLNDGVTTPAVREECPWNEQIIQYLKEYSRGSVEVTDEDLGAVQGKTLDMVITEVSLPQGPANWNGPRLARLRGELKDHGIVIARFKSTVYKQTPMRFGICKPLSKIAQILGKDVAKWLLSPLDGAELVTADEQPPPPRDNPPSRDESKQDAAGT